MGTWPGGWLEGRAGTWLGVLRSISSPAHSCVSTKQEDVLLEMWVCRNEWFNKETLWAVIRRGFLSVDKPLLMGEELIVATSELVQAAKAAHHLSRGVREVLTNIMTQSEQFWGYNQPVTLTPEGWQCPGHNLILLLSCSIWGRDGAGAMSRGSAPNPAFAPCCRLEEKSKNLPNFSFFAGYPSQALQGGSEVLDFAG